MNTSDFGEYLKSLIRSSGMTQSAFYMALGIQKPYFYDILSGRVKPPHYALQMKAMEILDPDPRAREEFYDRAALERHELPADIASDILDKPEMFKLLRRTLQEQSPGP